MAATTAGAIKALLEGAGLGVAVHRDRVPPATVRPYITVSEGITLVPDRAFNQNDDPEGHVREQLQVDIWQQIGAEVATLPDAVAKSLKGAALPQAPTSVSGVRLLTGPLRIYDTDTKVLHHVVTVEVRRTLTRT